METGMLDLAIDFATIALPDRCTEWHAAGVILT